MTYRLRPYPDGYEPDELDLADDRNQIETGCRWRDPQCQSWVHEACAEAIDATPDEIAERLFGLAFDDPSLQG